MSELKKKQLYTNKADYQYHSCVHRQYGTVNNG